ncbi:glycosyltransferase [Colwellia sp. 1_MG-2023]|uniref:glycosyltransferase family 2 protein n=1 Tax=Colwellia sp. 1_MG-2023 TaxID=3062649 RepID=UPI0026E20CE4|nr:glycosyltransferase [Colwellia sp. 1_MG-2023]MDO6444315.1 glycosyltransferase [Colwellia sp. 1_MG-2023]
MNQIELAKNNHSSLPLVSVYIPTKNRQELLANAIDSVLQQTYPNIEILVVDDGSTDTTFEFLTHLANKHNNIVIFKNEVSKGACAARNIAIKHANGEFVTGLDDDDVFLPNRIASLVSAYDDKYAFVCSSMYWDYGKKKRIIDAKAGRITLAQQLSYNEATSQVLVKKERVLSIGGFDEQFVACQDYDLWTRLLIKYGEAFRIATPSYIVNDTGSSERMIGHTSSVEGYLQYFDKHQHLMSKTNINNQTFMRIRRRREVLSIKELVKQLGSGHFYSKLRYFLSSNFKLIQQLHQRHYK